MVCTGLKFVSWKEYKGVCRDLRGAYTQNSSVAAMEKLQEFSKHCRQQYPEIAAT